MSFHNWFYSAKALKIVGVPLLWASLSRNSISEAYLASKHFCAALSKIGCELQPRDSCTYIPTCSTNEQAPKLLDDVALKHSDMIMTLARDSIKLLGFPLGIGSFAMHQTAKFQQSKLYELPILNACLPDFFCRTSLRTSFTCRGR